MLGINLSGAEFGEGNKFGWDYTYPTFKDLNFYAEKGLSLVRLPVRWERLQPELGGELNAAELGRLKLFLDNAQKAGVQVIVDLHNFGRYDGKKLGSADVPTEVFADFWAKLAGEIGGKPALLGYDLMNEPHGMPHKMAWPDAAQAATDAIRALGDTHQIFVEGEHWAGAANWAADNPFLDVKDPLDNIVYEAHVYFDKDGSGTYKGGYDQEGGHPDMGARKIHSFVSWLEKKDAKGFIGEFAVPSDDPRWQVVLDNFLGVLNEYGISATYWGAGSWFNGYDLGLLDKKGGAKASLGTLLEHVEAGRDVGIGSDAVRGSDHAIESGAGTDRDDLFDGTGPMVRFEGGLGSDTVEFSAARAGVKANLGEIRFVSIENLVGGAGDDALTGAAGANRLTGGLGSDRLDGKAGADTLAGGAGDDHYWVDQAGDRVVELVGEGRDTIHASVDWTLGTSTENLTLEGAAVRGTGNGLGNTMVGNAGANVLAGLNGDDVLDGGVGADRMEGGLGNDTYHVDRAGDEAVEKSREGADTVVATLDWTLGSNLENLTLAGSGTMRGTGNGGDNVLTGNAGDTFLFGLDGEDRLSGGAGNDRLEGGRDEDVLDGGAGDDVLIGGTGRDWLTGGAGRDRFVFNGTGDSRNSGMDRITDFTRGQDRIDLSLVDASSRSAGDQGFRFIGEGAFTRKAGELRFEQRDGYSVVQADTNGDGATDLVFRVEDIAYKLEASDFLL